MRIAVTTILLLALSQPVLADAVSDAMAALEAGDRAAAETLVAPLAAGSDPRGLFILAEIAAGDEARQEEATGLYRRAAVLGHADAALALALRALNGKGMAANPADAAALLQGLVDQDYGPAQLVLAEIYGLGTLAEPQEGTRAMLLEKAAANGLGRAAFLRGALEPDMAAALTWFETGAGLGDIAAASAAGLAWRDGRGAVADAAKAAPLLRQAADGGDRAAQLALAQLYSEGAGVTRDLFAAADLFRLAARQGDATAMLALGALYAEGRIGVRDRVSAYAWLKRAQLAGETSAETALATLAGKMKKADIARGEALALTSF